MSSKRGEGFKRNNRRWEKARGERRGVYGYIDRTEPGKKGTIYNAAVWSPSQSGGSAASESG